MNRKKTRKTAKDYASPAAAVGKSIFASFSSSLLKLIYPFFALLDIIATPFGIVRGILYIIRFPFSLVFSVLFTFIHLTKGSASLLTLPAFYISSLRSGFSIVIETVILFIVCYAAIFLYYRAFSEIGYWFNSQPVAIALLIKEKEKEKRMAEKLLKYPDTPFGREKNLSDFKKKYGKKLIPL